MKVSEKRGDLGNGIEIPKKPIIELFKILNVKSELLSLWVTFQKKMLSQS